jgi:DNA topoisomerase-3
LRDADTHFHPPREPDRFIPKEQAQKLLTIGRTELLEGFISKRGRPFSAYLKLADGKVGFEFPEKTAEPARP